jgi:hypothetical protein
MIFTARVATPNASAIQRERYTLRRMNTSAVS